MSTQAQIYQKHNSFETFRSSLNIDINQQRKRVVDILQKNKASFNDKWNDVLTLALKDLTSQDNDQDAVFKITRNISDELSKIDDSEVERYIFHRYRYDIYPKKRMLDAYPPYLQIEPTSVCNYRCVFCYQTDSEFTKKANGYMGSMTFDMFKSIVDQIEGNVEFISLASRGEPLICRDIDKMLEYTRGKFLGLKMNTNASMLNEEHCHAILSGGINTLVFSADAAKEPMYSQLRVNGKLEKVLKNINLFMDIKRKYYPESKIITRVSGVKVNEEQSMEVMDEIWGDLVDQIAFVAYNPWENVYESPVNDMTTPCSDLWRRMFIWFDGKVNPCDTDYKSILAVGNQAEQSVSQLWQSQGYDKLRKEHVQKSRQNIHPCKRCVVI